VNEPNLIMEVIPIDTNHGSVEMDLGLRYTKQDNPSFRQETDLIYLLILIKG
jgi:hypothetical protein